MASSIALLDDTRDGGSPTVVAPGVQETLIDSATDEVILVIGLFLLRKAAGIEDLRKGVFLVLEPKLLIPLDVSSWGTIRKRL